MTKYRFYRFDGGTKLLRKEWDREPTADEIGAEVDKLAKEVFKNGHTYVRFWDGNDQEYTMFDFGSWSIFGMVEPSVFGLCMNGWRS